MKDTFQIEVLEDGTLSIDTDGFTPQQHQQADEFVAELGKLMGGEVVVKEKRSHAKQHGHHHDHQHGHHHH